MAGIIPTRSNEFSTSKVKMLLIGETIRQRKNDILEYDAEYNQTEGLYFLLVAAMYRTTDPFAVIAARQDRDKRTIIGKLPKEIEYCQNIKNKH
jgi:hypothetical protein